MTSTNTVGYQNNFTEVESLGFNAEWDVSEALSVAVVLTTNTDSY